MTDAKAEKQNPSAGPGLYRGVDFDAYSSWDAVNKSKLQAFSRTPAHAYYEILHGGKTPTAAMDLGWYLHLALLEPEHFESEVVVPPKVDGRTKVGKATWAQFQAVNEGKYIVDEETHAKVNAMAASVLRHPTAGEFFKGKGQNEISILWNDEEVGVRCKARIDRIGTIGEWPIVGDLKTARDAGRKPFERAIHNFGYEVQAVHYLAGLEALYPVPAGNPFRRFVFFVVESEPPYLCAVYELDDVALNEGEQKRKRYLKTWRKCVESGEWPGYSLGIQYASLPPWALKEWQDID